MARSLIILLIVSLFTIIGFSECKLRSVHLSKTNVSPKSGIVYHDCGSATGVIDSINVTDCNQPPCVFERGKNYSIALQFTSKTDTKTAVNHVYGIIAKVPIPFHLPNEDGCQLGLNCPIKNGDSLSESVTLPVLTEYPKISLFVQWKVIDDSSKEMICFLFPVQIN